MDRRALIVGIGIWFWYFVVHVGGTYNLFVLCPQTINALNFLKEEHGVIHRGGLCLVIENKSKWCLSQALRTLCLC